MRETRRARRTDGLPAVKAPPLSRKIEMDGRTHPAAQVRADHGELRQGLEDDVAELGVVARQRPGVQLLGAAEALPVLLLCVEELLRRSVTPVRIWKQRRFA